MADTLVSTDEIKPSAVGLAEANPYSDGLTRRRCGKGWLFIGLDGETASPKRKKRCKALAIPPAWENVWIARSDKAHIQAVGEDAAGRRQYIYHPLWREAREAHKFDQLCLFAERLPCLRKKVSRILKHSDDHETLVLASITRLLDVGGLRIGSEQHRRTSGVTGATTLMGEHLKVKPDRLELDFQGKGGKQRHVELRDPDLMEMLKDLSGSASDYLFTCHDQPVTAGQVNDFLEDICGQRFTAKTFRTWKGSVAATKALHQAEVPTIKYVSEAAAEALGNTPAIARKSYIHPRIIEAAANSLIPENRAGPTRLHVNERRCFALIAPDR